jgi:polar amino acid transport system substrate-binding protein
MRQLLKIVSLFILGTFVTGSVCFAETVRIIAEDDWYPYSAKSDGGAHGIAVDIVRAAFKAEGVDVAFDVMNYDRGMELVREGEALGCFDAPRTHEIEESYLWHDKALFPARSFFYAPSDYQGIISNLQGVAGKKVGFTQGYGYGDAVDSDQKMIKEYSLNDKTLIRKLMAKRLDFIVLFEKVANYLVPQMDVVGKIKPVSRADSIDIYVAFSKRHPEGKKYRDIFSSGFRKIEEDGTYQKILAEWDVKLRASGEQ